MKPNQKPTPDTTRLQPAFWAIPAIMIALLAAAPTASALYTIDQWGTDADVSLSRICGQTDFRDGSRELQAGMSASASAGVWFHFTTPPPPGVPRGIVDHVFLSASASGSGTGTPTSSYAAESVPIVEDSISFGLPAPATNELIRTYDPGDATTENFDFAADASASIAATAIMAVNGHASDSSGQSDADSTSCSSMPWTDWWADPPEENQDCADDDSCWFCPPVPPGGPSPCWPSHCATDGRWIGTPPECCDEPDELRDEGRCGVSGLAPEENDDCADDDGCWFCPPNPGFDASPCWPSRCATDGRWIGTPPECCDEPDELREEGRCAVSGLVSPLPCRLLKCDCLPDDCKMFSIKDGLKHILWLQEPANE